MAAVCVQGCDALSLCGSGALSPLGELVVEEIVSVCRPAGPALEDVYAHVANLVGHLLNRLALGADPPQRTPQS